MPIFLSAAKYHDPFRDITHSSRDRQTYSPNWAAAFEEKLTSKMNAWGHESRMKTMDLTSGFEDMNLRDVAAERTQGAMKEAGAESQKSLAAIQAAQQRGGPVRSLSQLVKTRGQKRQQLQQARKSLQKAQDLYKVSGSSFKYESTGYNPFTPEASMFEQQFDEAVQQRKQEYAEMHGFASFDEVPQGYAAVSSAAQGTETGVGQRDIMDMIMRDITGVQYRDLVNLNIYDYGTDVNAAGYTPRDYTTDQMAVLKDFFVTSSLGAYEAANRQAAAEESFRAEAARTAKEQTVKGQKALQKTSKEQLGKSLEDVQLQIRELDEDFMKKVGSFNVGPRKKKVGSVSFEEGRPL